MLYLHVIVPPDNNDARRCTHQRCCRGLESNLVKVMITRSGCIGSSPLDEGTSLLVRHKSHEIWPDGAVLGIDLVPRGKLQRAQAECENVDLLCVLVCLQILGAAIWQDTRREPARTNYISACEHCIMVALL